ncbi:dynein regulatory complex subunit 2 [Diorhabda sublineata]|uniref:dynein regulatory complex subunit 2 n=1 Tax=Diorhabda sublineata TaxID=1163346 RepID=UPI0024E0F549|nr:dynein regulatory complex subunit 2 [Diorhabda sublineata]
MGPKIRIQLSPEEKAALKAAKRIEKKRLKLEKKKQEQRDVLLRELKFSDVTIGRHEKEWRQMLMDIALPHMRDELEFAWHNFELVIDNKDFTISLLLEEIKDSEEQYSMNCKNHIEHIDKLLDMFKERMEELKRDYDNEISNLEKKTEEEVGELTQTLTDDENYVKTILYILEMARKEQKANIRAEYFSKIEEEETKNVQLIQRLRGILEAVHFGIEKDIDEFLSKYNNAIKERKKGYEKLKQQDDALQELLAFQLDKIRKMHESIKTLRQELADSQKTLGRKLKDLETEFQFFNNAFNILKTRLVKDRELDAKKMEILTVNHNETVQALQKIKEKGEHILHIAAVCRKLETQEEKIRPFPSNYLKEDTTGIDQRVESMEILDLFWQRVGQAEASRYALIEERTFLKTENNILQRKIHEFCQCLQCPVPQTLDNEELNWPPYIGHISKNVTEAISEMKKYQVHDYPFGK